MNDGQPEFAAVGDGSPKRADHHSVRGIVSHNRRGLIIFLILQVAMLTSPLDANGEEPWDLIPAHASAVIRLQAPENTSQDVAEFADDIQPGFGALIKGRLPLLGPVISNPTLAGVDLSRDWYVAIFAVCGTQSEEVMLIPPTDVSAMAECCWLGF